MMNDDRRDGVREYYGETLTNSQDLKTNACCSIANIPEAHKAILSEIDEEVLSRFYGCGSPIPPHLKGMRVLDLGCGTGRDVYLLSKLVGEEGHVIGVDMTPEQLAVGKKVLDQQMKTFGFQQPNVTFKEGLIEDLASLDIADQSLDVVVSNCVINLSTDKAKVFSEIYRVLKPGGELYFSDVFSNSRLPKHLRYDKILVGECLGGALYKEDFRRIMEKVGFPDVRLVTKSPIELKDPEIKAAVGLIRFESLTLRAFKCPMTMEDRCEDYGQVAIYLGGIEGCDHSFDLDDHHHFEKNRPMLVCGNTAAMLQETRFSDAFKIVGDRQTHFGLFDCTDSGCEDASGSSNSGSCC